MVPTEGGRDGRRARSFSNRVGRRGATGPRGLLGRRRRRSGHHRPTIRHGDDRRDNRVDDSGLDAPDHELDRGSRVDVSADHATTACARPDHPTADRRDRPGGGRVRLDHRPVRAGEHPRHRGPGLPRRRWSGAPDDRALEHLQHGGPEPERAHLRLRHDPDVVRLRPRPGAVRRLGMDGRAVHVRRRDDLCRRAQRVPRRHAHRCPPGSMPVWATAAMPRHVVHDGRLDRRRRLVHRHRSPAEPPDRDAAIRVRRRLGARRGSGSPATSSRGPTGSSTCSAT